jgi:hypothetical protein
LVAVASACQSIGTEQMYRYLVLGVYRSGSTRLFNIIKDLLAERCGGSEHVRAVHRGNPPEAYAEMRLPGAMVLKEHELTAEGVELAQAAGVSVVGTIRDPVEAVVSLMSTFDWTTDTAIAGVGNAMSTLELFGQHITLVRYATATAERPRVMQGLLGAVGLECGWWTARRLCERYSHQEMAAATASLVLSETDRWDPATLFHPGHVGTPHRVVGEELAALTARVQAEGLADRYAALLVRAL